MKKRTIMSIAALVAILASVFIFTQGCEDDADTGGTALDNYFNDNPYVSDPRDSSSNLSIDPESVSITTTNETILFTVQGGNGNYSWGVSMPDNGKITPQRGNDDQAIYTANELKKNNVIVYDGDGEAAIAEITYSPSALSITPTSVSMANGDTVTFMGSGGAEPYTWSLVFSGRGNLSGANPGTSISYTATLTNTVNTIILTDDNGTTAQASITQTP